MRMDRAVAALACARRPARILRRTPVHHVPPLHSVLATMRFKMPQNASGAKEWPQAFVKSRDIERTRASEGCNALLAFGAVCTVGARTDHSQEHKDVVEHSEPRIADGDHFRRCVREHVIHVIPANRLDATNRHFAAQTLRPFGCWLGVRPRNLHDLSVC